MTDRHPTVERERERCKADLLYFAAEILGYGRAKEATRPHLKIDITEGSPHWKFARFLEKRYWESKTRVVESLCLMPRGFLKTTIGTIAAPIWCLANDPELAILVYAATADKATLFLSEIKDHLKNNERLLALFPELGPHHDGPWQTDNIRIEGRTLPRKESSITAVGLIQGKAGGHYYPIFNDDLHDESNSATAEQCEKVKVALQRQRPLLPDQTSGWIHATGTRWHGADAYGYTMDRNTIAKEKGREEPVQVISMRLEEDGLPTWPAAYGPEQIKALEASMEPDVFYSQYMNDPFTEAQQIFKKSDIDRAFVDEGDLPKEGMTIFASCDPAMSIKTSADYSAIIVWGAWRAPQARAGYLVTVLECWRQRVEPKALIDQLYAMNETWKPETIMIETQAASMMYETLLRDEAKVRGMLPYRPIKRGGGHSMATGKQRIRKIEPYLRNGSLRLLRTARQIGDLVRELQDYPKGAHDDLIDALADFPEITFASNAPQPSRTRPGEFRPTTMEEYLAINKGMRSASLGAGIETGGRRQAVVVQVTKE